MEGRQGRRETKEEGRMDDGGKEDRRLEETGLREL